MFCRVLVFFAVQAILIFSPAKVLSQQLSSAPFEIQTASSPKTDSNSIPTEFSASRSSSDELLFGPGELASSTFFVTPDPLLTSLRILTSLFFVIICILGISWLINRGYKTTSSGMGQVLGVLPIDSRRFLYVIKILGKVLVLGVTEHQINLLCEITDKQTLDNLLLKQGGVSTPGLDSIFRFLKPKSIDPDGFSENGGIDSASFMKEHSESTQQHMKQVEKLLLRRDKHDDEAGQ